MNALPIRLSIQPSKFSRNTILASFFSLSVHCLTVFILQRTSIWLSDGGDLDLGTEKLLSANMYSNQYIWLMESIAITLKHILLIFNLFHWVICSYYLLIRAVLWHIQYAFNVVFDSLNHWLLLLLLLSGILSTTIYFNSDRLDLF